MSIVENCTLRFRHRLSEKPNQHYPISNRTYCILYKQPCTVFHRVVRCDLSRKIRKTFFRHLVGYGWTSQSLVGGGPCPSFKPFYYLRCFHSRLWACARSETQNLGPIDDDIYTPPLSKEQLTRQLEGKDNSGLLYDVEVPS